MLFGEAGRILCYPIRLNASVTYANWTEDDRIYTECVNPYAMTISSARHLPVYKLETTDDLTRFKETFENVLTLDRGYDEVFSFNDVTSGYDDSFFDEHTILLVYVTAGSGSYRFSIEEAEVNGPELCLNVIRTDHPEVGTADMAGWLLIAEFENADLAGITGFDAKLVD